MQKVIGLIYVAVMLVACAAGPSGDEIIDLQADRGALSGLESRWTHPSLWAVSYAPANAASMISHERGRSFRFSPAAFIDQVAATSTRKLGNSHPRISVQILSADLRSYPTGTGRWAPRIRLMVQATRADKSVVVECDIDGLLTPSAEGRPARTNDGDCAVQGRGTAPGNDVAGVMSAALSQAFVVVLARALEALDDPRNP